MKKTNLIFHLPCKKKEKQLGVCHILPTRKPESKHGSDLSSHEEVHAEVQAEMLLSRHPVAESPLICGPQELLLAETCNFEAASNQLFAPVSIYPRCKPPLPVARVRSALVLSRAEE